MPSSKEQHRTLVRIVNLLPGKVEFSIPAWNHKTLFPVEHDRLPVEFLRDIMRGTMYAHVRVNIGVPDEEPDKLKIDHSSWEWDKRVWDHGVES